MNKEEKKKLKKRYLENVGKENSNSRNCYCKRTEKFCGTCEVCGKPGHIRHHPGAVPCTGSWCDFHYKKLAWTHPTAIPGAYVWLGIILLLSVGIHTLGA